jgi:protease I
MPSTNQGATMPVAREIFRPRKEHAMSKDITGKRVAILATDGFEQSELSEPLEELKGAGAIVRIVSLKKGRIKGWKDENWGDEFEAELAVKDARAEDFDALVLPGGVMNPDRLRRDEDVQRFVRAFFDAGKTVAAICHGPWTLIDAGVVKGRRMTSYASIQADLKNAGASWSDEEVACDRGLVTSRKPADLPAFIKKTIEEIAEGSHASRTARGIM